MTTPSRITIDDVARAARCSKAAASYALRDHPKISPARRTEIKRIARTLGYMPDPQIAKLMVHLRGARAHRFTGKLAFVNPHETDRGFAHRVAALRDTFASAVVRARELGYEFEEHWLHEPSISPTRLADILQARGIRGVLLGSTGKPAAEVPFEWRDFAAVTAGYTVLNPGIHRVVSHYYRNALLAVRQLAALGHERIGLVVFREQEASMDKTNLAALYVHHSEIAASRRIPPLVASRESASEIFAWFKRHEPDAVLAPRAFVLEALQKHGVRVPQDVSFANFLLWDAPGPIAGVQPGYERLGAAAVDLLVGELLHDRTGATPNPRIVLVEGRWADGQTVQKR